MPQIQQNSTTQVAPPDCFATLPMTMRTAALSALSLCLAACAAVQPGASVIPAPAADWRAVATADDRERLRDWREAFARRSRRRAPRAMGR